jgi:hypothetical protein
MISKDSANLPFIKQKFSHNAAINNHKFTFKAKTSSFELAYILQFPSTESLMYLTIAGMVDVPGNKSINYQFNETFISEIDRG